MAANPRAPPPRVLRGVRNGQQAWRSWIRTDRGWGLGVGWGLSGGLWGEQSRGGAGGRGVGLRRAAGRGRGGAAAAAAAAAAAPAGAAAAVAVAAAAAASGWGTEAKGSPVPGQRAPAARGGEGAVLGAGAGGGWSPRRGAVRAGTTTTKSPGGRVHGGRGAGRRKRGVGPATGLVGLAPRGSASGQSPVGVPRGPGRDREVSWTMEGALLAGVPPRGRLGQRDVRGKAGRSRPHLGWGFRVMEVREIVVGKDVVEGKGGREPHCKPGRPVGVPFYSARPPPPPVEALWFCFIVLKNFTVVCTKLSMR